MSEVKFPKEDLVELSWGDAPDGYTLIKVEDTGSGRWSSYHRVIFEHDGKLWASDFSRGLTEIQDESPYEYTEPVAYEVTARQVTTTEYVRV